MKLIIDIPENTYKQIQALARNNYFEHDICGNSMRRIADGTPFIERPKGKWIDIRVIKAFHYDGEPRVRCSCCGNEEEWSSNYCPNCGAEMEEGVEDGDSD